jgi:hypothetical protein
MQPDLAPKEKIIGVAFFILTGLLISTAEFGSLRFSTREMTCTKWVDDKVEMLDPIYGTKYIARMNAEVIKARFPMPCWFNGNVATFNDPIRATIIWVAVIGTAWLALCAYMIHTYSVLQSLKDFFSNGNSARDYSIITICILLFALLLGGAIVGRRYITFGKATCTKYTLRQSDASIADDSLEWRVFFIRDGKQTPNAKTGNIEGVNIMPTLPAPCFVSDSIVTFHDPEVVMNYYFLTWVLVAILVLAPGLIKWYQLGTTTPFVTCTLKSTNWNEGINWDDCKTFGPHWILFILLIMGLGFFSSIRFHTRQMNCIEWANPSNRVRMIDPLTQTEYFADMFYSEVIKPTFPLPCWFDGDKVTFNNPTKCLIIWGCTVGGAWLLLIMYTIRKNIKKIEFRFSEGDAICSTWTALIFWALLLLVGGAVVGARYINYENAVCTRYSLSPHTQVDYWTSVPGYWRAFFVREKQELEDPHGGQIEYATVMPDTLPAPCWVDDYNITFNDPELVMNYFFLSFGVLTILLLAIVCMVHKRQKGVAIAPSIPESFYGAVSV